MRNNTGFKKIPSACYTSSSFMNKPKLTQTINYTIKEENDKNEKESKTKPKMFKQKSKINCLKTLKKQFFFGEFDPPQTLLVSLREKY